MSREIKFRALHNGKRVYIDLTDSIGFARELLQLMFEDDNVFRFDKPLSQYTGLKDRNGKEIYEGDIVLAHPYQVEVTFERGCFWAGDVMLGEDDIYWIIVGNIYENPELLEVKYA